MYDSPDTTPHEPVWADFVDTSVQFDVLIYLQETGWAVKKQTFYNHCSDGKLKKNRKGFFTKRAVKKYAETWLVHNGLGTTVSASEENLAKEKLRQEIKRIETSENHDRFKLDVLKKKYVERSKLEVELSSRLVVLDHGLEYMFKVNIAEMVVLVGGDVDKAPLLLDMLLKKKDEQLTHFANMEDFTVAFDEG